VKKITDKGLVLFGVIAGVTAMVCTGHSEAALWAIVLLGIFLF
jgi:hypothetical protein